MAVRVLLAAQAHQLNVSFVYLSLQIGIVHGFWLCAASAIEFQPKNAKNYCFSLAAFGGGNFSFSTPASTAPPAFGAQTNTQSGGFGATPAFGQTSTFGASSK